MRETTPQVFLIAEPKINWDEVYRYLEVVGGIPWYDRVVRDIPWKSPSGDEYMSHKAIASDGELLAEFAGRGCYRSWAPELNANVKKVREDSGAYLDNILSSKHGAVLEHAQFTFQFHDVSRVFTHELVRHRAGVAISQESLRYVRLTDLGFRIPPILAEGPTIPCDYCHGIGYVLEGWADGNAITNICPVCDGTQELPMNNAVISIVERLEDYQQNAAEAFGLDDEGVPFHYKKEVTSALRRLAPIGLSTGMTWSANVRTLRHVIAQRTAPGAEEEIRLVFDRVARRMKRECPLLFGDFAPHTFDTNGRLSVHPVPDDHDYPDDFVPAWVPTYEKV